MGTEEYFVINHWNEIIEDEKSLIKSSQILSHLRKTESALLTKTHYPQEVRFFYRGESEDYGKTRLTPSVLRGENEKKAYYDALTHFPQEFSGLSSLSKLAKMQHYTYPTRLLDLTMNPLVALWFACSDYSRYGTSKPKNKDGYFYIIVAHEDNILTCDSDRALLLSCLAKLDDITEKPQLTQLLYSIHKCYCKVEDAYITNKWIEDNENDPELMYQIAAFKKFIGEVNRERAAFANFRTKITDLLSTFIVRPKIDNERLKKQEGVFAIFGIQATLYNNSDFFKIRRFRIPKSNKKQIIMELDKLGINEATLFGDMESRANYNRFMKDEGRNI